MSKQGVTCMISTLTTIAEYLGQVDIPMQQLLTFAHVAEKGEVSMQELCQLTGVGISSVSRNVARLGNGPKPSEPGYGLLRAEEDPHFRKQKLVTLTPRGQELLNAVGLSARKYLKSAA